MTHELPTSAETRRLEPAALRDAFLVPGLFRDGALTLHLTTLDRAVLGAAVPTGAPLTLGAPPELGAAHFTERRELGVLNVGAAGTVSVNGVVHAMGSRDILYVGRGSEGIEFASASSANPARFFLISYPAQVSHPTRLVRREDANLTVLGAPETANRRELRKYVYPGGVASGQLVMGVTEMQPGSVWNTMPPHTHVRRSEVYLYFALPADAAVVHLMGEPDATRSVIVRNEEAVLSPPWSIHAGCGTQAYAFCWAMGGENQDFADMQSAPISTLR
jgi:4-deoxy-L-threo-5-hexosulose-uronate ketol-isomerase